MADVVEGRRNRLLLAQWTDLLDQDAPFLRDHAQHLPAFAALAAGDDAHGVAPSHVTARHQMTSNP